MVETIDSQELGLEVAWLDDELDSIAQPVSYLEKRNFIVQSTRNPDEFVDWVCNNEYDVALTDLLLPGERQGDDVIRELVGAEIRKPIIVVSGYLEDFKPQLKKLSKLVKVPTVDKEYFSQNGGIENFRKLLLTRSGGGKLRVIERLVGYIKEEVGDQIIIRLKFPGGRCEELLFQKETLSKLGIGKQQKYLRIETVERMHANRIKLYTLLRWIPTPSHITEYKNLKREGNNGSEQ